MWAAFSFGAEGAGMWITEIITQVGNLGLAMKNLSFAVVKDEWSFFQGQMKQRFDQYKNDITSANTNMFKELQTIYSTGDQKIEAEHAKHDAHMAAAGSGKARRATPTRWKAPARKSRAR